MKTVCLYFEIHQNIHLKRYRFFDIGTDHYYYDDYENERSITETAERSYEPALKALLEMADMYGDYFKCAFSLSGCAIEMLETSSFSIKEISAMCGYYNFNFFARIFKKFTGLSPTEYKKYN